MTSVKVLAFTVEAFFWVLVGVHDLGLSCQKYINLLGSFLLESFIMKRVYIVKANKLKGSNYGEIHKKAFAQYLIIKKRSKRRPYIRSAYFRKDKIFLNLFWSHLGDKFSHKDKIRICGHYSRKREVLCPNQGKQEKRAKILDVDFPRK